MGGKKEDVRIFYPIKTPESGGTILLPWYYYIAKLGHLWFLYFLKDAREFW
jgi:hypothetical protein